MPLKEKSALEKPRRKVGFFCSYCIGMGVSIIERFWLRKATEQFENELFDEWGQTMDDVWMEAINTPMELDGERVYVHWNLRTNTYSVKVKGQPMQHIGHLVVRDAEFRVQPAGRERVRREQVKNVHAYVTGTVDLMPGDMATTAWRPVTYNPYKYDTFVYQDTEEPIQYAPICLLTMEGDKPRVYAP